MTGDLNGREEDDVRHGYDIADQSVGLEPAESGVNDQAAQTASESNILHSQLDELEIRLFGPEPRSVGGANSLPETEASRPALSHSVRHARQRIESANSRLGRIISRL